MNISKVGLCTVNDSSNVTMINEDGVIAEMIIEVDDDDNEIETHQPFAFELDDDDDCVEIFSSGCASPRNHYTGHTESHDWMHNGDALFTVKDSVGDNGTSPGFCNLNLLGESGAENQNFPIIKIALGSEPVIENVIGSVIKSVIESEPVIKSAVVSEPVVKSVTDPEKDAHECIVVDDACDNKPKRKHGKKSYLPKSNMVTRRKAAASQVSEHTAKEEMENSDEFTEVNDQSSQESEMNCESPSVDEGKPNREQEGVSGCGEKLGDIPYIQHIIQNTRRLSLRTLYKVTCGHRVPRDLELIKDRLLEFNGFPFVENSLEYVRKMKTLKTFPDGAIKQICYILGTHVGTKDVMSHGILKFLLKPKKNPNHQYLGAYYQPQVRLERLPDELLKFGRIEGKVLERMQLVKKAVPFKNLRKRKAVVDCSEVRLTRSAKRLMEQNEEDKGEKTEENNVPSNSDISLQKSREPRHFQVKNKSRGCEELVNSANCKKEVKVKKLLPCDSPSLEDSEDETDEESFQDMDSQALLVDSSDEDSNSIKGTLGRRLRDFIDIRRNIEKCDVKSLQSLHSILFNKLDRVENWKKNILKFSGFNFKCVSSRWKRKEFVLSLMSTSKLKEIADLLHLQYYSPRNQQSLTFNIMKFLSEPREGMLKPRKLPQQVSKIKMPKQRERRKIVHTTKKWNKQALLISELDEENTSLEVESLLQVIRRKRELNLCGNFTEGDSLCQSASSGSKKRKLGDIPNVQFMIITSNYEDIDNLHQLLFLQSGPRAKIRRNVQNFDGFIFGTNSFAYKIRIKLLNKMGYEVAKRIAFFLGLASKGTTIPQQDLNELIMHFLMCPNDIKCGSIKAYPKNFFNNNPTERPVVDITSIRDAVKKTMQNKKLEKDADHQHCENSEETEVSACEKFSMKCDISGGTTKTLIKTERESPHRDFSELSQENAITSSNAAANSRHEGSEKAHVNNIENTRARRQKRGKVVLSERGRSISRRKVNMSAVGRKKKVAIKKENQQSDSDVVKPEIEGAAQKQFLFTFDSGNKFDSKKLIDYLKRESQKTIVQKSEGTNTEVKETVPTVKPNVPLKVTPKSELSGIPKVISILLPPPPPSSPQKNLSVPLDLGSKTDSSSSNVACAPSFQNVQTSWSSSITSCPEGKIPIPSFLKKPMLKSAPQPSQTMQTNVASSHLTQIKLPPNLIESIKGSQIEGVIRLPQNFVISQNSVQASSSGVTNEVLYLPEVQKCLQQINSVNGKKKQLKMIKIGANNSIAIPPSSLNMGGGKVYVFPMKPGNQQLSSFPVSPVVTPMQLTNHIVVPSNIDSGTPVSIPQLIQVAKNYSRTVGTTALPVNNVTLATVKPDLLNPISFPVTSTSHCVFPVSITTSHRNIAPLPALKIKSSSEKEPNQKGPPFVIKSNKAETEKSDNTQDLKQQKGDCHSDSELDEEPLSHLVGHPSDDMLLQNVKDIVIGADLSSITMRNVLQKIYDKYPQFDLTYRKSFLKDTVKKVICCAPSQKTTG